VFITILIIRIINTILFIREPVSEIITFKRLTVLIIVICSVLISLTQPTDYKKIFGTDWVKAEAFVSENENWLKQLARKYEVAYPVAVAIIFPELIRYSALRDKMEITLLKTLYIYKGDEYADFSIGQFQMKPSFAELIHRNLKLLRGQIKNQFRTTMSTKDITTYRSYVVRDLEQPESQFLYLIAFMKICEITYDLKDKSEIQKVKFLATAYNYSFQKSYEEVDNMTDKKFFYTRWSGLKLILR